MTLRHAKRDCRTTFAVKMQPHARTPPVQMVPAARNADLWPVLPVGAGTAARSAAKGEYHPAVRMTLNAGVPAERGAPRTGGPSRRPPSAGCADQRSAFPCLRVALHGGVRPRRAPSWNCTFMPGGVCRRTDHEGFSRWGPPDRNRRPEDDETRAPYSKRVRSDPPPVRNSATASRRRRAFTGLCRR